MICPYPDCGAEDIPDDSPFCDMCGRDIFRCTNPDCGKITTSGDQFCSECGGDIAPNSVSSVSPAPSSNETAATEFMPMPGIGPKLSFNHIDGWSLELTDGDILGRTNGNHIARLGNIKVISGTHAKITHAQDGWYITDQDSLNKTWVNNQQALPSQPVKIKADDVITLANIKFTVTEL